MKKELKDKDIIYLYITGETSPLGTWRNMIPDIHGEHFRVTDEQWSYLREKSVSGAFLLTLLLTKKETSLINRPDSPEWIP